MFLGIVSLDSLQILLKDGESVFQLYRSDLLLVVFLPVLQEDFVSPDHLLMRGSEMVEG